MAVEHLLDWYVSQTNLSTGVDSADVALASLLGLAGYACAAAGFAAKKDQQVKVRVFWACVLNSFMYASMAMYVSSGIVLLTGVRFLCALRYPRSWVLGTFFLVMSISMPYITGVSDWLSVVPGVLGSIAVFWLSGVPMRLTMMVSSLVWVCINLGVGNWVGVFGESMIFSMGFLGLWRFLKSQKPA